MKLSLSDINEIESYILQKDNEKVSTYETETIKNLLSDLKSSKEKIQDQETLLNKHQLGDEFNEFMFSSSEITSLFHKMEYEYYEFGNVPATEDLNVILDHINSLIEDGVSLSSKLMDDSLSSANANTTQGFGDLLYAVEQRVMNLKSEVEQIETFEDMFVRMDEPEMEV